MSFKNAMNQYVIADPKLCIGCNTCMASCSQEHQRHGLQSAPRLQVMRNRLDSAPVMCHQCEDAPARRCVRLMLSPVKTTRFISMKASASVANCAGLPARSVPSPFPAARRWTCPSTVTPQKRRPRRARHVRSALSWIVCRGSRGGSEMRFMQLQP